MAEGLVNLEVFIQGLASKAVVEPFANHTAECLFEFLFGGHDQILSAKDPGSVEANFSAVADTAKVGEFEVKKPIRKVEMLQNDEPIWLLHVGCQLGQIVVRCYAYRRRDALTHLLKDGVLHFLGEFTGDLRDAFGCKKAKTHLVDTANLVDGEHSIASRFHSLMEGYVGWVISFQQDNVGALFLGVTDHGSAFDSELLGFVGSSDAAS